jgi:hypothetical protein
MTEFFDHYNIDLNFQYFPLFKYFFLFKNVVWLKIVNVLLLSKFIFFIKKENS